MSRRGGRLNLRPRPVPRPHPSYPEVCPCRARQPEPRKRPRTESSAGAATAGWAHTAGEDPHTIYPVAWKYHHVGNFMLNDVLPPNHGQL